MGLEYQVNPNDSVFIRLQLAASDTGLYPQTKIYAIESPTTVVATVNLDEIGNGLYGAEWINDGIRQKYFTQTIVYTNSGYTSQHPIIRPDSDSINVGFNTTGGILGGAGSSRTKYKLKELTDEEIQRIASAVYDLLKPELDKKSEFNVETDIVKTDIVVPEIPEIYVPSPEETAQAISLLLDSKEKSIVGSLTQVIVDNKVTVPEVHIPRIPKVHEISAALEDIVKKHVIDYTPLLQESKEAIIEAFLDNAPQTLDYSAELKALQESNESVVSSLVLKQLADTMKEDVEKVTSEDFLTAVNNKMPLAILADKFNKLTKKDKQLVFSVLQRSQPRLLAAIAKAIKYLASPQYVS